MTIMKKIIIIDGGPRRNMNTAQMLEKPCARDPRSPVPLTLAVQNSLTL